MSRFFKDDELACKCGRKECDAPKMDMHTIMKLDGVRVEMGLPIVITSALRCAHHNKAVGGSNGSFHMLGKAVDIHCPNGGYMIKLVSIAMKHGFTGIGIKKNMVHFDTRPGLPILFGY